MFCNWLKHYFNQPRSSSQYMFYVTVSSFQRWCCILELHCEMNTRFDFYVVGSSASIWKFTTHCVLQNADFMTVHVVFLRLLFRMQTTWPPKYLILLINWSSPRITWDEAASFQALMVQKKRKISWLRRQKTGWYCHSTLPCNLSLETVCFSFVALFYQFSIMDVTLMFCFSAETGLCCFFNILIIDDNVISLQ